MTNGRRSSGARVAPPRDELGAHMSIAGGLHRALERGAELACGSVQIFLKNQRQWAAKPMADEDVRAFAAARRATRTAAVFAHASYLINLGAPDDAAWRQAVDVFTDELERGEALGLSRVLAFRLNGARAPLGSGLDRHEHIGVGFLGLGVFRCLLNDRRFARVPKVLETPKEPEPEADRRNLARLRGLRRTPRSRSRAGPAGRLSGTT